MLLKGPLARILHDYIISAGMEFKDLCSGAKNSSSLSIFSGLTGAVLCCTGAVFQNQFLCLKTNHSLSVSHKP